MKTRYLRLFAATLLASPHGAVNAALVGSDVLSNVAIAGVSYDVRFWQDEDGFTELALIEALPMAFTTESDAVVARDAVFGALLADPAFDFTPVNSLDTFYIAYSFSPYSRAWCNTQPEYLVCGVGSPVGVTAPGGAFATFELSAQVPEAGTLALLGLGLAGLGLSRRCKAA